MKKKIVKINNINYKSADQYSIYDQIISGENEKPNQNYFAETTIVEKLNINCLNNGTIDANSVIV